MGLDQFAYKKDRDSGDVDFYWRKHAKLHTWMEQLYTEKTGASADNFNCVDLELTLADIERLEADVRNGQLPECSGGLFFGHQWQDEQEDHYKKQDLEFCKWAKATINAQEGVIYSCWW